MLSICLSPISPSSFLSIRSKNQGSVVARARRHSKKKKKDPDVLLSSGSFFTFPWRFLRHCRRPTNDLAFLRRAPLHRFASRLLFIYPGTNGRRTADVGGQRRRTTLLVPHKRDTRISILALARFSLSPAGQLWLRGDKERRKGRIPYERGSLKLCVWIRFAACFRI